MFQCTLDMMPPFRLTCNRTLSNSVILNFYKPRPKLFEKLGWFLYIIIINYLSSLLNIGLRFFFQLDTSSHLGLFSFYFLSSLFIVGGLPLFVVELRDAHLSIFWSTYHKWFWWYGQSIAHHSALEVTHFLAAYPRIFFAQKVIWKLLKKYILIGVKNILYETIFYNSIKNGSLKISLGIFRIFL